MQYYKLSYFYPVVEVCVTVNRCSRVILYSGKSEAVSEMDSLGQKRGDDSFPWRSYNVGDEVIVRYCPWFPGFFYISFNGMRST